MMTDVRSVEPPLATTYAVGANFVLIATEFSLIPLELVLIP